MELLVVVGVVIILAFILSPLISDRPARARESARRILCFSNLSEIAKACATYQERNGDFFPAFWDGERFDPMKSLAMLYPNYVDNVKVFGCPSTDDRPAITVTVVTEKDKRFAFGPLDTNKKCSYFYDERTNGHLIGPGQAIATDADGQTWLTEQGRHPPYPPNWTRQYRMSNHENGQNVMYFDGHVKWMETVYASRDPNDNIFCPQAGWGADTDAYLWDGVNARAAEIAK
jgi:prepilin-type processing-associated H-X9-DG protein